MFQGTWGADIVPEWDQIDLAYTGSNLTGVTYYLDGAIIQRLVLTYSGSTLIRVNKV